jgi:hypothetical protein
VSQDAERYYGVEPRRGTVLRAALEAVRAREAALSSDVAIALVRPQLYTVAKLQRLADRGLITRQWPPAAKGQFESTWRVPEQKKE